MSALDASQAAGADGGTQRWNRRPANRAFAHAFNLVFAVVGVFFLVFGYNSWAAVQPIAGGRTTTGTIVSVSDGENCDRYGCSPNWTPTISFEAPGGRTYTFTGPTSSGQLVDGQTVTVSYLPSNPAVAHDISASGSGGVVMIFIGIFAIIMGVGSFILGFSALHRRTGLSSAREGSGWVGHKVIHSNQGVLLAVAIALALVGIGFFVI